MTEPLRFHIQIAPSSTRVQAAPARVAVQTNPLVRTVIAAIPGTKGDKGDPGDAFGVTAWWSGEGPPGTIIGSKVGDYYVDTLNGLIYKLGD